MCITEYDETKVLAAEREEGRAEGRAEGIYDTLTDLVKKGILSISLAAQQANLSVSEFELKTGLKATQWSMFVTKKLTLVKNERYVF